MKSEESKYLSKEILNLFYSQFERFNLSSDSSYSDFQNEYPAFEKVYRLMNGYLFEGENKLEEIEKSAGLSIVTYLKGAYCYVKENNIQSLKEYDDFSEKLKIEEWKKLEQVMIQKQETAKQIFLQHQMFMSAIDKNKDKYSVNMFKKNKID